MAANRRSHPPTCHAGHVDDASSGLPQQREERLRHLHGSQEVHVHVAPEGGDWLQLGVGRIQKDPGVVDQSPEPCSRGPSERAPPDPRGRRPPDPHLCRPPGCRCSGGWPGCARRRSRPAAERAAFQRFLLSASELQPRGRPARRQTPARPSRRAASPARVRTRNRNLGADGTLEPNLLQYVLQLSSRTPPLAWQCCTSLGAT